MFAQRRAVLLTVCGLLIGVGSPASAQDGRVEALRLAPGDESVRVDGLLSEGVWSRASPMSGFRQREPDAGAPATERTEVRLVYDDETLFIGVMAYDSEPDALVARILQRDKIVTPVFFGAGVQFAGDDGVAILLDPFDDNRNGVIFATNPNGAEFEALLTDEGSELNIDWRGVWEVRAARTDEGWSAEFAIPWRTLRYPGADADHEWGINVHRVIRRKNEDVLWQAWQREGGGLQRVSRAGSLGGLDGLPSPGFNAELKPFVLTGQKQEADDFGVLETDRPLEAGFDLKTELRPGLLLDLTYNTDFAQVEVDDAQVNLTRFSLFFPEKRDFFLENSGIFDFGIAADPFSPPPFQLFFSRQIGIAEDGEVPIIGGGRLTGRVGRQTVGFMNVVTDRAFGLPRESFSVARIKRDIGESNYIGGMLVDRRSSDGRNTAAGIDGQFVIGDAWIWDWFGSRSFTRGPDGNGFAYMVGWNYQGERWGSFFNHYGISPNMEAEAGFITRTDIRRTDLYGSHTFRPDALGLREISVWGGAGYGSTVTDGRLQDWIAGVAAGPEWDSGDNISVFVNASETVIDEAFELTDSIEVPPGRYRADHVGWFGGTSQNRAVFIDTNGLVTKFHGGTLVSVGASFTAALSPRFSIETGFTRNDVEVPDGSFVADITSVRATWSFSTRLSTNVLLQHNSLDDDFSANVRFNFIHRPGSDLFIVFTENRHQELGRWGVEDRGLVMKITYLARL